VPPTKEETFQFLTEINDPEIPVLNIVEMGIVKEVELQGDSVRVVITPTYSGCPAMKVIEEEIVSALQKKGFENVTTRTVFSPSWTTDWLSEETKRKLKEYGIAPPGKASADDSSRITKNIHCPFCDSDNTELRSEFGSTACKSLHYCNNCQQPFEHFKCI
jgi:ring-1,2-phenylacetyl-CoA epoxidase subunit PaaD